MKIKVTDKIRIAYRRALGKKNYATITYCRKSDEVVKDYSVDMNFIEDKGESFNTYGFACGTSKGSVRTFYKDRISKVALV